MKILWIILGIIIALLVTISCKKDEHKLQSSLSIQVGMVCGWCVSKEQLNLRSEYYTYERDSPCSDSLDLSATQFELDKGLWNNFVSYVALDEFSQLDLNSCHACADGCDYWIVIEDSSYSHEIRFGSISDITHQNTNTLAKQLIILLEEQREHFNEQ